jgi:hypothetical protein
MWLWILISSRILQQWSCVNRHSAIWVLGEQSWFERCHSLLEWVAVLFLRETMSFYNCETMRTRAFLAAAAWLHWSFGIWSGGHQEMASIDVGLLNLFLLLDCTDLLPYDLVDIRRWPQFTLDFFLPFPVICTSSDLNPPKKLTQKSFFFCLYYLNLC